MTGSSIWDRVLSRIETKVNRHIFYTWFKPTAYVADQGGSIVVRVPNVLFRDWLTKHYSAVLNEALGELGRAGASISFVTEGQAAPPQQPQPLLDSVAPPNLDEVGPGEVDAAPAPITAPAGPTRGTRSRRSSSVRRTSSRTPLRAR